MMQKDWPKDVAFFVLTFLGFSILILMVNIVTGTWNGGSGHALATVLTGVLLVKYRWRGVIPNRLTVTAFSVLSGISAIIYLYMLLVISSVGPALSFEILKGYEILLAFTVNALVFAGTMWLLRKRVG